jgi:DNA replication protein DnaC
MDNATTEILVKDQCRQLRLPTVGARCMSVEQEAIRNHVSHSGYLSSLLEQELEDRGQRRAQRRIVEARFPQVKPLADFQFAQAPTISASQIVGLAEGGYIERGDNVLFVGDGGTGKTMLATALGVAACRQGRAVRFTTVAALVNELLEARDQQALSRVVARWARVDLMIADELGYVRLPPSGAELLFQVLADRAERASVIVTTNLPFSEWTTVFPDPRLCKAVVERLTYRSTIIETGTDSYRFKQSLARSQSRETESTKRTTQTRATVAASAARSETPATADTNSNNHAGEPES